MLAVGHIVLRPWRRDSSDLSLIRKAALDPDIARYSSVGAATTTPAADEWLAGRAAPDRCDWVMEVDTAPVGRISIASIDVGDESAELGYWVLTGHRRRGYARAGVTAAIRYAVDTLGIRSLRIEHERDNDASCSLARTLGFGPCAPASAPILVGGTSRHLWVHTCTVDAT